MNLFDVKPLAKPFVKWAGGKTQLLRDISSSLPSGFSSFHDVTYVEPFVGGGAVLFWILQTYPNIRHAVINDVNKELICTYKVIKENVVELIAELSKIQAEYLPLDANARKDYYLAKRNYFNGTGNSPVDTAALFIFLNRTCFNGLYRVNSKGKFNVPHGRYANPHICDAENLSSCSDVLKKVEILCGDFTDTERYAKSKTLFYLDPPYKPVTETSSFTSYTKGGFDDREQIRLRDFCDRISAAGSFFIASNSDPEAVNPKEKFFGTIYKKFNIRHISATRMINSDPDGRGRVAELLISNI